MSPKKRLTAAELAQKEQERLMRTEKLERALDLAVSGKVPEQLSTEDRKRFALGEIDVINCQGCIGFAKLCNSCPGPGAIIPIRA